MVGVLLLFEVIVLNERANTVSNPHSSVLSLHAALAILLDDQVFSSTDDELYRSYTTKVFGMVGGIAFLTLMINGTLAGPLLKKLGLAEDTAMRHRIVSKYDHTYKDKLLTDYVHLLMDPIYQQVDFAIVQQHIPYFADVTEAQFREAVGRNKAQTPAAIYREPDLSKVWKCLKASDPEDQVAEEAQDEAVATSNTQDTEDSLEEQPAKDASAVPLNVVSSSVASTPEEQVELTMEFRKIFVELLRSAYQKLIDLGELDGREGYTTYALLEGLNFATDAVEKGEPLADWDMTVKLLSSWTEPIDRYVTRMLQNITSCSCSSNKHKRVFHNAKQLNPEHEKSLGVVKMTIGFTRAHEIAEHLFKKEIALMGAPQAEALVLEESQAQMKLAKEVFDRQSDKEVIVSHIACSILINKAARFEFM